MAVDCGYGVSVKRESSASPVVARQYAAVRSDSGVEALSEVAVREDGTISLRVVLYE